MELFRNVNVDWLGKKWYFLGFSLIFSIAGLISMGMHYKQIGSPVPLGVDFRGGTDVQVQFTAPPNVEQIRKAMDAAGIKDASIVDFNDPSAKNEVLISLPVKMTNRSSTADASVLKTLSRPPTILLQHS